MKWCILNWVVQSCYFKQIIWIPLSDFTLTQVSRSLNQTLAQNLWWNLWYSPLTSASFWYFMLLEKGMYSHIGRHVFLCECEHWTCISPYQKSSLLQEKKQRFLRLRKLRKLKVPEVPLPGTLWDSDGVLCYPSRAAQWGMQLLWSSVLPEMGFLVMQVPLKFPCPGK